MAKVATSPLPPRGSPPLHSGGAKTEVAHTWANWLHHPCRLGDPHRFTAGGQKQKWPIHGQGGYITPAASGIPTASERGGGGGSEVAHKWARWLHHPCRLRDPQRFRAGGKIRSGPYMGKVATSPLPPRGSPPLQSGGGGGDQKWPTSGQGGYITPAASGIPTASERGGGGGGIRSGPQVGKVATSPLPPRGSQRLRSGGPDQKWPKNGQGGYITTAASGIPTASKREAKSEVAHTWAMWLHHHCRLGDPHGFRAGGEIRSGP